MVETVVIVHQDVTVVVETVVLVLVVVLGTETVVVCVTYLGKAMKVTALVATMTMAHSEKATRAPTLILSSLKTFHPTHCV